MIVDKLPFLQQNSPRLVKDPERKEAYHKKVDENIKKNGFNSTFVFGDDSSHSFCYSTGIYHTYKIPELFISALPQNLSHDLIHGYVDFYKKNKSVPLKTKITTITDRFPVYIIEVENEKLKDYVLSCYRFYGSKEFKCSQLIYPDTKGKFPNDPGYDYDQEIMGNFDLLGTA